MRRSTVPLILTWTEGDSLEGSSREVAIFFSHQWSNSLEFYLSIFIYMYVYIQA